MERRSFLATGVPLTLGVAVGPLPTSDGTSTTGPEAAVQQYFDLADSLGTADSAAFASEVDKLAHTASPLPEVVAASPSFLSRARQQTITETRILAENIDPAQFSEDSTFLRASLKETDASVADNAVVGVQFASADVRHEWFVATENEEWRLVYFRAVPNSPKAVSAAYYRRASRLSVGDSTVFAERIAELIHSTSPLPDLLEDNPGPFINARRATVRSTQLLAANINPTRITSRSDFLEGWLSDADLRTLTGRNAVVSVALDLDRESVVLHWFLALENDMWRLVWVADLPTTEHIVESFYDRAAGAESRSDFADDLAAITHPVSNLTDILTEQTAGEQLFTSVRDAQLVELTVAERDLPANQIVNEFFGATDTTLAEFQDRVGATAVVKAIFQLNGAEATQEWVVATDGPVWRLVGF